MTTLTTALVEKDGALDRDASTLAFQAAYDKFVAERTIENEQIANAVNGYFDRYPGAGINMPALTHGALQTLNAQPGNYKDLEKRVQTYVRSNASDDRAAGKLFKIGKGPSKGGVRRWAEIPVEAPKAEAAAAPAAEAPAAS